MGDPAEAPRQLAPVLDVKRRQNGPTDEEVVILRRQVVLLHASTGSTSVARSSLQELLDDLGPTHEQFAELSDLADRLGVP